jgi:hypothetical protein
MRLPRAAMVAAVAGSVLAAGCTGGGNLQEQARAGNDKSYIAGDGSYAELAPSDRGEPVDVTGTSAEGHPAAVLLVQRHAAEAGDVAEVPGHQRQHAR